MKDKNTVIGIVLLAVLFFVFFWYTNKQQQASLAIQKHIQDSLRIDSATRVPAQQKAAVQPDSLHTDSLSKVNANGNFAGAANMPEQLVSVENELIKVLFTTKGGTVKSVELKKYNAQTGGKVILGESSKDAIGYSITTGANNTASTNQMNFVAAQPVKNADGSQAIQFTLLDSSGTGIVHQYIIKPNSYLIDWNIQLTNAPKLLSGNRVKFHFAAEPMQVEKSVEYERRMTNV